MLSERELRLWLIGITVVAWLMLVAMVADHYVWPVHGSPEEVARQMAWRLQIQTSMTTAGRALGLLMISRFSWALLRSLRARPHGHGAKR